MFKTYTREKSLPETPREKSLPEAQRIEPTMLHHTGQRAEHTTNWAITANTLVWQHYYGCWTSSYSSRRYLPPPLSCHHEFGDNLMLVSQSAITGTGVSLLPEYAYQPRGRYHWGRRPSSDDSFHSPTVFPLSALNKPSIMKRYHRLRVVCLHDTGPRSLSLIVIRGWYRFYFQTGFLPVWGSKNRYKNRLTVNDEAPLV